MSPHATGPWVFEANTGRVVRAGGETVAFVSAANESALRDGPVLAAAPELLKACKSALYLLKGREHDQFLRDVIAKAEAA